MGSFVCSAVSLKPDLFEGLKFDFNKPLNMNFALSHRQGDLHAQQQPSLCTVTLRTSQLPCTLCSILLKSRETLSQELPRRCSCHLPCMGTGSCVSLQLPSHASSGAHAAHACSNIPDRLHANHTSGVLPAACC